MATTVVSSMLSPSVRKSSPLFKHESVALARSSRLRIQKVNSLSRYLVSPRGRAFSTPQSKRVLGRSSRDFSRHRQSFIGAPVIINSMTNRWCHDMWLQLQLGRSPRPHRMCKGRVRASLNFPLLAKIQILLQRRLPVYLALGHPLWLTPPAVAAMAFAIWALGPCLRFLRKTLFRREDYLWDESRTRYIMASYIRPVILWIAVLIICRGFDPIILASETSQAIKERFVNFVRSLATVLAFAFCTASLTQQIQKFMVERQDDVEESRNLGVQFVGNTVYTLVWVAAVCLFMELLGFSTQKWITAGGFGTVLLTLAGRELVTNFLSSIMIHATRPFMVNEWIQTKIEGQEVSGTVEHVGWWEPTIIRGDDREAVHIPNHKFSVSVVRNLSQKTHWRIKAFFGISHYDVGKIGDIVATMRKVIAKHPQLEQKHLHRRVVLEHVNPENQALMIMVSCFVKTSHFEEYLRVKEEVLLDLLNVISLHGARLATPIRSVQRIYDESDNRGVQYRDDSPGESRTKQPYFLVETQQRVRQQSGGEEAMMNGGVVDASQPLTPPVTMAQQRTEASTESQTANVRKDNSNPGIPTVVNFMPGNMEREKRISSVEDVGESSNEVRGSEVRGNINIPIGLTLTNPQPSNITSPDVVRDHPEKEVSGPSDSNNLQIPEIPQIAKHLQNTELHVNVKAPIGGSLIDGQTGNLHEGVGGGVSSSVGTKGALEGLDSMGLNSRDITLLGAAFEKLPTNIPEGPVDNGPYVGISQPKGEKVLLDERFVRPKSGGVSPGVRPTTTGNDVDSVITTEDLPSNIWTNSNTDAVPLPDAAVGSVKVGSLGPLGPSDSTSSGNLGPTSSPDDRGDRSGAHTTGGGSQKQSPSITRSQSVEDNLVLEVALGGPKIVLDLSLDAEPPSQLPQGSGKESNNKEESQRQPSNPASSESAILALSGSRSLNFGTPSNVGVPSD